MPSPRTKSLAICDINAGFSFTSTSCTFANVSLVAPSSMRSELLSEPSNGSISAFPSGFLSQASLKVVLKATLLRPKSARSTCTWKVASMGARIVRALALYP